jgi:hypothetical protein
MKPDAKVREDVIRQLQWDAQVPDPDVIGVAVKDGAVTLTGHVTKYAQKLAAVHAAEPGRGPAVGTPRALPRLCQRRPGPGEPPPADPGDPCGWEAFCTPVMPPSWSP